MSHIKFQNIKAIRATFEVDIEFIDDGDNNTYNYRTHKFHPFVIGNDENKDTLLYPDNVKIEFSILESIIPTIDPPNPFSGDFTEADYEREYYSLVRKLSFIETRVIIKRNGVEYLRGYVDPKNKTTEFDSKSFEITILGNIAKLKEIDPRDISVMELPEKILYVDLIRWIMLKVYPGFGSVFLLSDIKSETSFSFLGQPWIADVSWFGDFGYYFVGPDVRYTTMIELLKAVVNSLGCIGIVKGNNFYLQPRHYFNSETPITLTNRDYLHSQGPTPNYSQKLNGLQTIVHSGLVYYEDIQGTVLKDENGFLEKPDEVETLTIYSPGGDPPGIDGEIFPLLVRNIWIWVPDFVAGIGNGQWITSVRNSFFSTANPSHRPMWMVVRDLIWPLIQKDRLVYNTQLNTINWEYNKFYKLKNNDAAVFRPRKISYDEFEDISEVSFIEC